MKPIKSRLAKAELKESANELSVYKTKDTMFQSLSLHLAGSGSQDLPVPTLARGLSHNDNLILAL